jgi:hypothetical protein
MGAAASMTTRADLEAICDLLVDLANDADGLTLEEGVEMWKASLDVLAQTRATISMLETRIKDELESPKQIDNVLYRRKSKGVNRFDHPAIARAVLDQVRVDYATGEVRDLTPAVEALRLFTTIYLSASSQAKKSALRSLLGPEADELVEWERTGSTIEAIPLEGS